MNIATRIADIILRLRLIRSLQSWHVIVSTMRMGNVGSRPVLWKWHSLRLQLLKHLLMQVGFKVQTPPVATLLQSWCSHTGNRRSNARLGRAEILGAKMPCAGWGVWQFSRSAFGQPSLSPWLVSFSGVRSEIASHRFVRADSGRTRRPDRYEWMDERCKFLRLDFDTVGTILSAKLLRSAS